MVGSYDATTIGVPAEDAVGEHGAVPRTQHVRAAERDELLQCEPLGGENGDEVGHGGVGERELGGGRDERVVLASQAELVDPPKRGISNRRRVPCSW